VSVFDGHLPVMCLVPPFFSISITFLPRDHDFFLKEGVALYRPRNLFFSAE